MIVVAGTQLDHDPKFWDKSSDWYLPQVKAIMLTYADFHKSTSKRKSAMDKGIHEYLGVGNNLRVYLDNGSFAFWRRGMDNPIDDYVEFVNRAKPDWYPIPADFIPHPQLDKAEQKVLFDKTMAVNLEYVSRGFVPVMHVGDWLEEYLEAFERCGMLRSTEIGLGGLVPRLLSSKGSTSRENVIQGIKEVRWCYQGRLHVFGIGGLGTLHLAESIGVDSIDSSGWRNRAARGLILLPGRGERTIVPLGNWRGVQVSEAETQILSMCECPACSRYGPDGLRACNARSNVEGRGNGTSGFNRRAIHNLWTLIQEAEQVDRKVKSGEYQTWYPEHVASVILRRLIKCALDTESNRVKSD